MNQTAVIQKKVFLSAILILFALLVLTGILTYIIPSGTYDYVDIDGVMTIVPGTFTYTDLPAL
ncbi:MAG: hypothetical protein PHP32_07775, partial [Candidatus Izemoplasmatales bacterium]|nr:hypothetical protein [Candidatus Izemoplasmatales bacterium]